MISRMNPGFLVLAISLAFLSLGLPGIQRPPAPVPLVLPATSTPTSDPFVEPPLPPNPTKLDLGRNLYWHWCMPCHGDRGQGLTDDFRALWEPDHQDCWVRGCHGGLRADEGFPIPTTVPALATSHILARFHSLAELSDYIKATHPPQSPGILSNDEYHAIAAHVLALNEESVPTVSTVPTSTTLPAPITRNQPLPASTLLLATLLPLAVILALLLTRSNHRSG